MIVKKQTLFAVLAALCVTLAMPCRAQDAPTLKADTASQKPEALVNEPTEAYRLKLLDLAWQAATAYPLNPHIKNRARAEAHVVEGALGIGQAQLASDYADQVVNWRRGASYAEIAHYLLEHDAERSAIEYYLRQAVLHSKDPKQGWRQMRVKARVAEAKVLMGDPADADALIEDDDVVGQGKRIEALAAGADVDFDQLVSALDGMVATQGYDAILAAMNGYAQLYQYHYDNPERRALLIAKLKVAWKDMSGLKRFEVMQRFLDAAIKNDDTDNARKLVDELEAIYKNYRWGIDFDLRLRSDIAKARLRVGQKDAAAEVLASAASEADKRLDELENFYRAGALRPVAEGFALLGNREKAHDLYKRCVELGAVNPNIRPRISDINASCVSMALHGVEPDTNLLASIQQIVTDLSKP